MIIVNKNKAPFIFGGLLAGLLFCSFITNNENFKKQQLAYSRVKSAYIEKWNMMKSEIHSNGIDTASFNIFFRAFKKEKIFELWALDKNQIKKIKEYTICATSGTLGPKRMQGDLQVPEGFYHISVFNPFSSYHLSLGLNYPNKSDKILGKKGALGGDIMIHGSCVTIGCIPLTDDKIKEVYVMAVEAKSNGQSEIPVHIFPMKLNKENVEYLKTQYANETGLLNFWDNIKEGYDYFESKKIVPKVSVNIKGEYIFNQ